MAFSQGHIMICFGRNSFLKKSQFHFQIPLKSGSLELWSELAFYLSWEDMKNHLFTPHRMLGTEQRDGYTQIYLFEPASFLVSQECKGRVVCRTPDNSKWLHRRRAPLVQRSTPSMSDDLGNVPLQLPEPVADNSVQELPFPFSCLWCP